MTEVEYREGQLSLGPVSFASLADEYGTPLYVYSEDILRERAARLKNAFRSLDPLIRYSCKANSNLSVLRAIRTAGFGADVISGGELALALAAGFPAAEIIMEGPGKSPGEIREAILEGVALFSVESTGEFAALGEIARACDRPVSALLRLNPDIRAGGHRYINTGLKENKFGLTAREVESLFGTTGCGVEIAGLHLHLGSQVDSPEPYLKAIEAAREIHRRHPFRCLDLGGGFPIRYQGEMPGIEVFGDAISRAWGDFPPRLMLEPGRYLAGPAGFLLTRVLYRKERPHRKFLVVDAGMNDLLRPSLYEAWHGISTARESAPGDQEECDVVGPICETGDFIARGRRLPGGIKPGDLLVVGEAGAYGYAMSSNYNSRPRAAEVMVRGGSPRLSRRRETARDLLALFEAEAD